MSVTPNCAGVRSSGTSEVHASTSVDGMTSVELFKEVSFAPKMLFNLTSNRVVDKAGFEIVTEDDHDDSLIAITRIVQKETGRTWMVCIKTPDGLNEPYRL